MLKKVFFCFFIWVLCINTNAQHRICEIDYVGLKKTKEVFLNRFLTVQKNENVDTNQLNQSVRAFLNTQYFETVHYKLDTVDNCCLVQFVFKERIAMFPIFGLGQIKGNKFVQVGFVDHHWLGKGGILKAWYLWYDRHSVSVNGYLPYIQGSDYGLQWTAQNYSTIEPLYFGNGVTFYNYDNRSIELLGVREISQNHSLMAGGSFFQELYNKNPDRNDDFTEGPDNRKFNKWLGKVYYERKQIDYDYYYLSGWSILTFGEYVHTFNYQNDFYKWVLELKGYKRVTPKLNLATRIKIGLATNRDSPFAPFVVDSYMNIRGVGNRVDRGTGQFVINAEVRQTIYEPWWGAIQLVGFWDWGTWRLPGQTNESFTYAENIQSFAGIGGRFALNKLFNAILRLDYGVNLRDSKKSGFVFGIGQYF